MGKSKKALLAELLRSLRDEPESWRWDDEDDPALIVHRTNVSLWIFLGSAHVYKPRKVKFSLFGKMRLRHAFRKWRRLQHPSDTALIVLSQLLGAAPIRRAA